MKNKYRKNLIHTPLAILALATAAANAGTTETMTPAPATPAEDVISGVLKLDFNTHFVSYGLDVWADGSSMSEPTFNPNLELYFALPADFTLTLGTWWDVNSKPGGSTSPLGGRIQEVDVYAGLGYTYEKFTVGLTYQAWMYGGDTEDILDLKFAYDTFLSPSLTIHQRLDQGAANGDEGTILVLGVSHSIEAGPVTISFPVNLAYFLTDGFHQEFEAAVPATPAIPPSFGVAPEPAIPGQDAIGEADAGFGYLSIGVGASLPLTPYIGEAYGEWALNGGVTYFITDDDTIPNNPQSSFLTASLGLSVAF